MLLSGFSEGFRLQYTGPRVSVFAKNLVSAENFKSETRNKLQKEVDLGRILGPFLEKPISNLRVSPIGLVPKNDGGWRLITHLSHPCNSSVNDFIDPEVCKVKYSSMDKVLDMISLLGKGALLGKIDISQAFRLLIVNPADFDLLGIHFDGMFYIDKCLPMGCAISCALFEKFSTFLHWAVAAKSGLDTLDHYLDDFIFAGSNLTNDCAKLMHTFMDISVKLGVPIAKQKTVWPTKVITFLGLTIDTVLMMVRIPEDKLDKLKCKLSPFVFKKRVKVKDLESVTGLMAFCSKAIPSARAFTRRFYDLISAVKNRKPYHSVKINQDIRADAMVWLQFLNKFNGCCFIPDRIWITNETLQLFTDSTGNCALGCGAYYDGHWVQYKWPSSWSNSIIMSDVTFLELVPIVLALLVWGHVWENKKILFRIDNQALVSIVNKRTSKSKLIMNFIRPMVLLTMSFNIQFKAIHIEGIHNEIADALSRFQMKRFRDLAPSADQFPVQIPAEFLKIISEMKLTN